MRFRRILRRMGIILCTLLLAWAIAVQAGCFTMRTSDKDWGALLLKKGQAYPPRFLDVPDVQGRRIHAVAIETADSLPLCILVHGSPGASDAYTDYLSDTVLSRALRLAALDRPGFGYTEGFGRPEGSLKRQSDAVKALADALAPGQKIWLLGHSLGAPVIVRFAMEYPELTAGLVLVAGSVDPAQEEHPWWQKAVDVPPLKWLTPKPLWTSNAEIIPLEKELEAMRSQWSAIRCPVHIIHAVDDRLVPFANVDFAKRMLVNSPDIRETILQKGDHFILWSEQALVKRALLDLVGH